jgi:hypothetical protein
LYQCLKEGPYIILLFPLFWSSNWFTTYQQADFNAALFNVRTRSLNSLLFWGAQIIGALTWGLFLDYKFASRKTRARIFHGTVFVLTMAIWGGGYAVQKTYTRASVANPDFSPMDYTDSGYVGKMFLYMFYGAFDAILQTYAYWLMGALSNSSRKLALYAGFYNGIQSAGAAVMWRLDALKIPYLNIIVSNWALLSGSLLIALPLIWFKIEDQSSLEDDAMFTDGIHADELNERIHVTSHKLGEDITA